MMSLMGVFLVVFVHRKIARKVSGVEITKVATGYGNKVGNKGGILCRLTVNDSSLVVTCVHLAAGQGKAENRVADMRTIHEKGFQDARRGKAQVSSFI